VDEGKEVRSGILRQVEVAVRITMVFHLPY